VATGGDVVDNLDPNLSLVSANASLGNYDSGVWSVGMLGSGGSATLTIVATVGSSDPISNTASAFASQTDWNSFNDSASVTLNLPATTSVDVALASGWNLISLPLIPPQPQHTDDILSAVDWNSVDYWNGSTWLARANGVGGPLNTMQDGKGYYLLMNSAGTLPVGGVEILPPPNVPPSYPVANGWNMIGFKSVTPEKANVYLSAIDGKYTIIYRMVNGIFSVVRGSDNMRPGEGYWIAIINGGGTVFP